MRSARAFLSAALMIWCANAGAGVLDGSVTLYPIGSDSSFRSWGQANYYNDLGGEASAALSGTHSVTGPQTFTVAVTGDGSYSYDLEGPAQPGSCYNTSLTVTANPAGPGSTVQRTWYGQNQCADPPPPPPGTTIEIVGCPTSPILINLHDGSFPLAGAEAPVWFDIDANGERNRMTWTKAGSAVAFLARDRNGNGRIDDGSELFGNATVLRSGTRAVNGFEALMELDANTDGQVNALDEAWSALLLWTDTNHDGVSQSGEIRGVAGSPVEGIETAYQWTGRRDTAGNLYAYQGRAYLDRARRPIYDVYFGLVP